MNLERIKPTRENLYSYLEDYPEHQLRYDLITNHTSGIDCADISCGVGYGTYMIGELANSVKGYDVSSEALKYANKNFTRDNVSFHALADLGDAVAVESRARRCVHVGGGSAPANACCTANHRQRRRVAHRRLRLSRKQGSHACATAHRRVGGETHHSAGVLHSIKPLSLEPLSNLSGQTEPDHVQRPPYCATDCAVANAPAI